MIAKAILLYGAPVILVCDGKCNKAWGVVFRPKTYLSEDPDDVLYAADGDLGDAPEDPGTYEGGQGKHPRSLNKWCARQCERSTIVSSIDESFVPQTWQQPVFNKPQRDRT